MPSCSPYCCYMSAEEAYDVLSRKLWATALAEVPPDEEEFRELWGSLVSFCNLYGSTPTEKHKESFSKFEDPSKLFPGVIPAAVHHYLNKLYQTRSQ